MTSININYNITRKYIAFILNRHIDIFIIKTQLRD